MLCIKSLLLVTYEQDSVEYYCIDVYKRQVWRWCYPSILRVYKVLCGVGTTIISELCSNKISITQLLHVTVHDLCSLVKNVRIVGRLCL